VKFLTGNDLRKNILKLLFSLYAEVHHDVKTLDATHLAYENSPLRQKNHFTQFSAEILRVIERPLLSKRALCYILIIVTVKLSVTNSKHFKKGLNA
jgi:hypothetical protein